MKEKYRKRVDKTCQELSNACVEISKLLLDISLDKKLDTACEFIEKDKKLYYKVEFVLPVMDLK